MTQTLTAGDDTPHRPEPSHTRPVPGQPSELRPALRPRTPCRPNPVQVRAGSPESLLAIVPGLLGFVPQASLVVIGTEAPHDRIKVTLRYDLPDPPGAGVSADIAAHAVGVIGSQRLATLVAVGYGPGSLVDPVAGALGAAARTAGIDVLDILRVEDGRYWSYFCADRDCCPAAGMPFDPAAHSAAAALASAGNRVLADRAAVAARVAPLGGIAAESMRQATRRAERHAGQLLAKVRKSSRIGAARRLIAAEGLNAVGAMIATYRAGGKYTTDYQIAWLTVALRDLRVRDDAWARMDPAYQDAHRRLWIDVTRRAQPGYVAAPAALLALASCRWPQVMAPRGPTRPASRAHARERDCSTRPPSSCQIEAYTVKARDQFRARAHSCRLSVGLCRGFDSTVDGGRVCSGRGRGRCRSRDCDPTNTVGP